MVTAMDIFLSVISLDSDALETVLVSLWSSPGCIHSGFSFMLTHLSLFVRSRQLHKSEIFFIFHSPLLRHCRYRAHAFDFIYLYDSQQQKLLLLVYSCRVVCMHALFSEFELSSRALHCRWVALFSGAFIVHVVDDIIVVIIFIPTSMQCAWMAHTVWLLLFVLFYSAWNVRPVASFHFSILLIQSQSTYSKLCDKTLRETKWRSESNSNPSIFAIFLLTLAKRWAIQLPASASFIEW